MKKQTEPANPQPGRWQPRFTITPGIASRLMEIEAARRSVEGSSLPAAVAAELRRAAHVRSSHYSTRIEGNRLTLAEAEQVIAGRRVEFHGRSRDILEVRNYSRALQRVETWAEEGLAVTTGRIRRLHALVESGTPGRPTPYRDGQNVIRDAASGALVYLPPEAKDDPSLMDAFVRWLESAVKTNVPIPLIAVLAHYQIVTIHPFYDGNGRTARLLESLLLKQGGFGLGGFVALEERYADDLADYYRALTVHPHHNYYEGRADVDLTGWLEYAVGVTADVCRSASEAVRRAVSTPRQPRLDPPRLEPRARRVLGLFSARDRITTAQVARKLGLSPRMARVLMARWVEEGWLEVANPSRRARSYRLSAIHRQFIGNDSGSSTSG